MGQWWWWWWWWWWNVNLYSSL